MNLNEHREILRKNDLEMMKKLDKIIYDAKPKPVPEVRPVIPKTVYMKQELTGTPEYKASKQQADLLLSKKLDSLISSAMNAISGKTPEKDTKVSQEAQDEYQSMTPIEVGGKQQLYYDVPIPPLPPFVPKPYTSHFTDPADFKTEKEKLLVAIKTSYIRREQYQNDINNIEGLLNAKAYASLEGFTPSMPSFDKNTRKAELLDLTKEINPKTGIVEYTNLQPLLDMRDAKLPKSKARVLSGLLSALLKYEEEEYNTTIKADETAYVGTKVAKTESALQADLMHFKGLLAVEEAKILNIETDLGALDADYENFMRTNEENAIEETKVNNERRLLATDALNTFKKREGRRKGEKSFLFSNLWLKCAKSFL